MAEADEFNLFSFVCEVLRECFFEEFVLMVGAIVPDGIEHDNPIFQSVGFSFVWQFDVDAICGYLMRFGYFFLG